MERTSADDNETVVSFLIERFTQEKIIIGLLCRSLKVEKTV